MVRVTQTITLNPVVGAQWAHVSTAGIDKFSRIIVDASDLWQDIEALVNAQSDAPIAHTIHA